jgi:hypothetical protein
MSTVASTITVIDLSNNNDYDDLWKNVIKRISKSSDKLKNNYINLNPKDFPCFTAIIENNEIVCFSALQIDLKKWGQNIARCSTRMWIAPEKRFNGMTKFSSGSKFLNSYYCLPLQIQKSKDLGIKCLFMSREENPKAFGKWAQLVNNNCRTNFIFLEDRYNVCGNLNPIPVSCKQYICLDISNNESLSVWKKNMQKFFIEGC